MGLRKGSVAGRGVVPKRAPRPAHAVTDAERAVVSAAIEWRQSTEINGDSVRYRLGKARALYGAVDALLQLREGME